MTFQWFFSSYDNYHLLSFYYMWGIILRVLLLFGHLVFRALLREIFLSYLQMRKLLKREVVQFLHNCMAIGDGSRNYTRMPGPILQTITIQDWAHTEMQVSINERFCWKYLGFFVCF